MCYKNKAQEARHALHHSFSLRRDDSCFRAQTLHSPRLTQQRSIDAAGSNERSTEEIEPKPRYTSCA
jgi:hypothetical protein